MGGFRSGKEEEVPYRKEKEEGKSFLQVRRREDGEPRPQPGVGHACGDESDRAAECLVEERVDTEREPLEILIEHKGRAM